MRGARGLDQLHRMCLTMKGEEGHDEGREDTGARGDECQTSSLPPRHLAYPP